MTIEEETPEFRFVQNAIDQLGVKNLRPDLEPGGLWIKDRIRITWGLRLATEPPTIQFGSFPSTLNGIMPLPRDLEGRLEVWRNSLRHRDTNRELSNLDFRDLVLLSAIIGWKPETASQP